MFAVPYILILVWKFIHNLVQNIIKNVVILILLDWETVRPFRALEKLRRGFLTLGQKKVTRNVKIVKKKKDELYERGRKL